VRRLARLGRLPAVHFLLVGGVLYVLAGTRATSGSAERPRIVLSAADVARLRGAWTGEHGAPPGPATEERLVADAVEEEMLVRTAVALGVDRTDPQIRARLVQVGRFLGDAAGEDDSVERDARGLDLVGTDVVVRRQLAQTMRLAAGRLGPADLPTDAEVEAWLAAHPERFLEPARLTLTHVYLGRDRRGDHLTADAEELLAVLRRDTVPPDAAAPRGDTFLRGAHLVGASDADLDRVFGPGFAARLDGVPIGAWSEPVPSAYGLHLVWIEERLPSKLPPLAKVRGQVVHRVLDERRAARRETRLAALRARWDVVVEREPETAAAVP